MFLLATDGGSVKVGSEEAAHVGSPDDLAHDLHQQCSIVPGAATSQMIPGTATSQMMPGAATSQMIPGAATSQLIPGLTAGQPGTATSQMMPGLTAGQLCTTTAAVPPNVGISTSEQLRQLVALLSKKNDSWSLSSSDRQLVVTDELHNSISKVCHPRFCCCCLLSFCHSVILNKD